MKSIFKKALVAVPAAALYFLFSFHASLLASCGSTDSTGGHNNPHLVYFPPTGSQTPASSVANQPRLQIQTGESISAGSQLVLECALPDCTVYLPNGSSDSTGHGGGPKIILVGTIPFAIPKNTDLVFRIVPKGDPARSDSASNGK